MELGFPGDQWTDPAPPLPAPPGGSSHWEEGWRLPPGPLPPCPAFQGQAACVHCWAGNKKQWLPLEEVCVKGLLARVGAGAREN